jgi:hypothetical protein
MITRKDEKDLAFGEPGLKLDIDEIEQMRKVRVEDIEFILKIPRSLDLKIAEEINERHRKFVEQEISRFSLALRDAERLSAEYRHASRRSREGAQGSNEQP